MKKILASLLRAIGFIGVVIGGVYAFALTFSGGFNDSKVMWTVFLGGILCVLVGDGLNKSEGQAKQPQSGELAEVGLRFKAAMIDALPFLIAEALRRQPQLFPGMSLIVGTVTIAFVIFQWVLLTQSGQTIGKKLQKIRIVKLSSGENGGFVTNVLKRQILNGVLSLVPLYFTVDCLFIFRKDRRCIHDLVAGTQVVNA